MNLPARIVLAVTAFGLLLAGCSSGTGTSAVVLPPGPSVSVSPDRAPVPSFPGTAQPAVTQPPARHAAIRYPVTWTLPDRRLSPGAVQPGYGIRDICPDVNKALEAMRPSTAEKNRVYAAYGITHHVTGQYEIDHIVPIELLGLADAPAGDPTENLYPELNDTPDPVMLAKYGLSPAFVHNSKDILEDVLHAKVCAGTVPLATAQHAFETDWRAAYARYVGKPPGSIPVPSHVYRSSSAPQPTRSREVSSPVPVRTHTAVAPTSHAAAAGCHPRTSGGNCYRAGELCRKADRGATGIAGNGEAITCRDNSGWRWEPA